MDHWVQIVSYTANTFSRKQTKQIDSTLLLEYSYSRFAINIMDLWVNRPFLDLNYWTYSSSRLQEFIVCECKVMHVLKIRHLWKCHFPAGDVNTSDDISISVLHTHHVVQNARILVQTIKHGSSKVPPKITFFNKK